MVLSQTVDYKACSPVFIRPFSRENTYLTSRKEHRSENYSSKQVHKLRRLPSPRSKIGSGIWFSGSPNNLASKVYDGGQIKFHAPSTMSTRREVEDWSEIRVTKGVPEWSPYWENFPRSNTGLNFHFLEKTNGGLATMGNLPLDVMGKVKNDSGVLIGGSGIDLAEWTPETLTVAGLDIGLVKKLSPFCQLRGKLAHQMLQRRGLELSPKEAEMLQTKCLLVQAKKVGNLYNQTIQGRNFLKSWEELTDNQRTVIFNYLKDHKVGAAENRGPSDAPIFWHHVTEQNWPGVVAHLKATAFLFRDHAQIHRREAEAELLEKPKESSLPGSGRSSSCGSRSGRYPNRPSFMKNSITVRKCSACSNEDYLHMQEMQRKARKHADKRKCISRSSSSSILTPSSASVASEGTLLM